MRLYIVCYNPLLSIVIQNGVRAKQKMLTDCINDDFRCRSKACQVSLPVAAGLSPALRRYRAGRAG